MKYVISGPVQPVQDTIYLPSSKSISNRLLVMQDLAGQAGDIQNLSHSDDTLLMQAALEGTGQVKDVGHAGTAMRFLTALYAVKHGKVILTGSERMKQRPVGPLVQALRDLGADIRYLGKEGCPPLEVPGGLKRGGRIRVDGGISSQFISALMMIGPVLEGGLDISLQGDVVSSTYIHMTRALMESGGVRAVFHGREIRVAEGSYVFPPQSVESDWTNASYWFQVAALLPGSVISLPRLDRESLQGDAVLVSLFRPMGVESSFEGRELVLRSSPADRAEQAFFSKDFTGCPDLVQTLVPTLCARGTPFRITGTRTLRVKETDRIAALQKELGKLGFSILADEQGEWISWDGNRNAFQGPVTIETYHDHRMAMAFAPLAIPFGRILIEQPLVVTKSYPRFWEDLQKAGFSVETA